MMLLQNAPLHEPLRIAAIPLAGVRARCAERGLREGAHASCAAHSPNYLLLETASGLDVLLDRRDAAVIEVEMLDVVAATDSRPHGTPRTRLCA